METLRHIVLFVHLVGFAVLFGAWAVQAFGGKREIVKLMHIGVTIAAVAGLALAAPWGLPDWMAEDGMNYAKIGTKLVVLLIIGALLGIGQARQRKSGHVPSAMFWGIGVLTLVNAGIAVIW
ncbi:Fe-S protein [Microbacterium sp.]|uniref:Fe-S protein n=1 Tax=Microbacterium sp. TaxID=51671 RepID=UPI0028A9B011|nr:Fe-S protein [Microbacterium sp.]